MRKLIAITVAAVLLVGGTAGAERIKDIAYIRGERSNPLWGSGLVVGLNGTGDDSEQSRRSLTSILRSSGLVMNPGDLSSKNIASVLVTAELGAYSRRDSKIDVTVSTIGDASSLQGGTLMITPLMGGDGEVYAVAAGQIVMGGFTAAGKKAKITKNHTTAGRIPDGATVEKDEIATYVENGQITLLLRNPDFTTAENMAKRINGIYPTSAFSQDPGAIRISVPKGLRRADLSGFVQRIYALQVKVDARAVVVLNERTGTIVVGQNVGVSTVGITHGSLSIIVTEKDFVSQPTPFSNTGTTRKFRRTEVKSKEEIAPMVVLGRKVSVSELARALNAMGLTPRDLIAIFQSLKEAKALQAELKVL